MPTKATSPMDRQRLLNMDDGLNEMLAKTSLSGMVSYQIHSRWVREHPHLPRNAAGTAKLILRELYDQPFLIAALESTKGFFDAIDATHVIHKTGEYEVSFNLLKLIHIPADHIGAREQAIEYFRTAAEFFESHTDNNADIQYTNVRDKKGLHGAVTCRAWCPQSEKMVVDEAFTFRMNNLIADHSPLDAHLMGMAKTINRMGPHSWLTLNERQVFGPHKGPRCLRVIAESSARQREQTTA